MHRIALCVLTILMAAVYSERSVDGQDLKALEAAVEAATKLTKGIAGPDETDVLRRMQSDAFVRQTADFGRWGHIRDRYSTWVNHSNRLIPIYTYGFDLGALREAGSAYADADRLTQLYGGLPEGTVNPTATYFDQTDVYRLQMAAADAGFKHIIVMVFDGMDWQTTRNTSIYKTRRILYDKGRGAGLAFQDYRGTRTDFGLVCTSAKRSGAKFDVNSQVVLSADEEPTGGYDPDLGGRDPWHEKGDHDYLIGLDRERPHTVTDSAASATSMFSGEKTYNGSINFTCGGKRLVPVARQLQSELGFRIGIVTSVPVSHATLAAAYANNVTRKDYQDISRDLLGLASSSHREDPLSGVDVLIGAGWGETLEEAATQGDNFLPGNSYLHDEDIRRANIKNGGAYTVVQRKNGTAGRDRLLRSARRAAKNKTRFLGFFGGEGGHLPFQTADGGYNPTVDVKGAEQYQPAVISENPNLADMTEAALMLLEGNDQKFWLLIEAGDVDWANHSNNIDNSIGAVLSGESAFETVVRWVEKNDAWADTALIVTSDHGHYFVLEKPELIVDAAKETHEK